MSEFEDIINNDNNDKQAIEDFLGIVTKLNEAVNNLNGRGLIPTGTIRYHDRDGTEVGTYFEDLVNFKFDVCFVSKETLLYSVLDLTETECKKTDWDDCHKDGKTPATQDCNICEKRKI